MKPYLLACALLATPAFAADPGEPTPMTPSDFRHYAEGHTLYFSLDGKPYGSEAFGPDGEAVWRFEEDGFCMAGVWRPYGGQLCFYYGGGVGDAVSCWRLMKDAEGMFVKLLGDSEDAGMELRITGRDQQGLDCGQPDYPPDSPGEPGAPGKKT